MINIVKMMISVFNRVENVLGENEKMLVISIFYIFKNSFKGFSSSSVIIVWYRVNPFPNDKIWALTKLKALADDKFNLLKC